MKRNLVLLAVALFAILGFVYWQNSSPQSASTPTPTQVAVERRAVVEITANTKESKKFEIESFTEGTTALGITEAVVTVKKKGEGEQAFVTSIDGLEAKEGKREFWAFYVNGKQAEVGAGTYKVQNGDVISWKIENY